MPESKKRTIVKKEVKEKKFNVNPAKSKFTRILILILTVGMVLGILVAAVYAIVSALIN